MPQNSISSGTGDIVLAPEKKSRRKLIIILIVMVLIVGGITALVFVFSRKNLEMNNYKLAFNEYANYLLYGKDSDEEIKGEYDDDGIYLVYEIKNGDNDINMIGMTDSTDVSNIKVSGVEFFDKAESLLNNSFELLNNESASIINETDKYKEYFELYKTIVLSNDSIGASGLQRQIGDDVTTLTKKQVLAQYDAFINSSYSLVRDYGKKAVEFYSLYEKNETNINNAGCTLNDDDMIECVDSGYNEVANTLHDLLLNLSEEKENARKQIVSGCWAISSKLKEGSGDD